MFWVALTFLIVAGLCSITLAVTRAWRVWKALGNLTNALTPALEKVSVSAAVAEERANSLDLHTTRLEAASVRLQQSLAELAVLRAAAGEARAAFKAAEAVMPRK